MCRKIKRWLWWFLVALDQLLNTFWGGYPDETFSSRTYRKAMSGQWFWQLLRCLIDKIFFWDSKHCQSSYEFERTRGHGPWERGAGF